MTHTRTANRGMRTGLLAALAVLTSCVFLTGLSMPDTPRPQRHTKSQLQTFVEDQAVQNKQQAKSSARVKQTRDASQKAKDSAPSLEDIETRAKHKQIDRSGRTVLPSKKLH